MTTPWVDLAMLGAVAGGLGLFLLGMNLMTDGLKLTAGPALHRILSGATRTRAHALGSGMLITAIVQSSSAVTVAAIGFVNAGLLALGPALWVLFGANVGTTTTGWVVALVGLKFKVEALAMPLVGVGALMRLFGDGKRSGAAGTALAGFGLLFMGIALLQQAFGGLAERVTLPQGEGPVVVLMQLGIGLLMTVLTQSSSAAMAITLTAAQGGLIDLQGAAAVVIGANVGTTVKAMLAAIGATPNARRAAAAHVIFNVLTAVVALLLLPWFIGAMGLLRQALDLPPDPAVKLALFHTVFNVLGVLLMWPLTARLTLWLQQRFRAREDDEAQPRYLDENVLAVPTLALDALAREVARAGQVAVRMARAVLAGAAAPAVASDRRVFAGLDAAIEDFIARLGRAPMSQQSSARLTALLRTQRYQETCVEQAEMAAALPMLPGAPSAAWADGYRRFAMAAGAMLDQGVSAPITPAAEQPELTDASLATAYEELKSALLSAGARGELPLAEMEQALRRCSALRRAAQQAVKAQRHIHVGQLAADDPGPAAA